MNKKSNSKKVVVKAAKKTVTKKVASKVAKTAKKVAKTAKKVVKASKREVLKPMSESVKAEYLSVNKLSGNRSHKIEGIGTISVDAKHAENGSRQFKITGSKKYSSSKRYSLGQIRKMLQGLR